MKKAVPAAVAAIVIIVAIAVVAVIYHLMTPPKPLPASARAGAGPAGPGRGTTEALVERFDKMSEAEREKHRTGLPGQRGAWRRWAEAKGVPIPKEEPPMPEIKNPAHRATMPAGE